jgi:uncharacterized protein YukE
MNKIRANFGTIDQTEADLTTHSGTLRDIADRIETEARSILEQLGMGVGHPEFEGRMAIIRGKIAAHLDENLPRLQQATGRMGEEYLQGANAAAARLGGGRGSVA